MSEVWKQHRRVQAGSLEVTDLDMSISVDMSEDDGLKFEVDIYNLNEDSWERVSEDDPIQIELGWKDGVKGTVTHGIVKKKYKEKGERNLVHKLRGHDQSDEALKFAYTKTWDKSRTPSSVVRDIVSRSALQEGQIDSTSGEFGTNFIITDEKPIRHWFDQLKKEAEKTDDQAYEWFAEAGNINFVRQNGRTADAITLSFENTLVSLGDAEGDNAEDNGLKFEALCEPKIRKDATVYVDTDQHTGAYKVKNYSYTSDSTNGDHNVSGHLLPLGVEYETEEQRQERLKNDYIRGGGPNAY